MYKFVTKDGDGKLRFFYSLTTPAYNKETKTWGPSKFDMGLTEERDVPDMLEKWFGGSLACGKIVIIESREIEGSDR